MPSAVRGNVTLADLNDSMANCMISDIGIEQSTHSASSVIGL
jgi:hypothetical protein